MLYNEKRQERRGGGYPDEERGRGRKGTYLSTSEPDSQKNLPTSRNLKWFLQPIHQPVVTPLFMTEVNNNPLG
jgi:hypothetical protein